LAAPPAERTARFAAMRSVLSRTSWDATAAAIDQLIDRALAARNHRPAPASVSRTREDPAQASPWSGPHVARAAQQADSATRPVVVVGAGPTGLSAAYHLGDDALLLEQNGQIGGWCRSIQENGFTFDFAGHIMFSNDPYVHEMYKILLGD